MTDKPYDPEKVKISIDGEKPIEGPIELVSQCRVCKSVNCIVPIHVKDKPAVFKFTLRAVEQNKRLTEKLKEQEQEIENLKSALWLSEKAVKEANEDIERLKEIHK